MFFRLATTEGRRRRPASGARGNHRPPPVLNITLAELAPEPMVAVRPRPLARETAEVPEAASHQAGEHLFLAGGRPAQGAEAVAVQGTQGGKEGPMGVETTLRSRGPTINL